MSFLDEVAKYHISERMEIVAMVALANAENKNELIDLAVKNLNDGHKLVKAGAPDFIKKINAEATFDAGEILKSALCTESVKVGDFTTALKESRAKQEANSNDDD